MNQYQLVIRIPIEALDDLEARMKEREIVKNLPYEEAEIKLQEIFPDKIPRGIGL